MKICQFIIFFFTYLIQIKSNLDLELSTKVMVSVQKYFASGCIFLLYTPGFKNLYTLRQLRKRLTEYDIETSILTFQMLGRLPHINHCRYVPPLCVVTSHEEAIMNSFQDLPSSTKTSVKWLLFASSEVKLEQIFDRVYIPFHCEFWIAQQQQTQEVLFTEVYHVSPELPVQNISFGSLDLETGSVHPNEPDLSFYQRRSDLLEIIIKASYFNNYGITIIRKEEDKYEVGGFFGDVWLTLQDRLNFRTKYVMNEDDAYGSQKADGTWTGMIGMMTSGKVDVAVQALSITIERKEVVDFTMPLFRSSRCIFIRRPDESVFKWDNFLKPFSVEIWVGVLFCMIGLTIALSATYYIRRATTGQDESQEFGLLQSFDYVYTSFCQQGCYVNPTAASSRLVCWVAKLTATVLLAGYSAYLIAHLAVYTPDLPFTSLEGLLEDGTYELGFLANSFISMYYSNTRNRLNAQLYRKLVKPNELPTTEQEAMDWVCSKKNYAFLGVLDTSLRNKIDCHIAIPWKSTSKNGFAFPLAKNNSYRGIIEYTLHNMRRTGVLNRLRNKWWPPRPPEEKKPWDSLSFQAVASIMLIPLIGIVASIIVLSCEFFVNCVLKSWISFKMCRPDTNSAKQTQCIKYSLK